MSAWSRPVSPRAVAHEEASITVAPALFTAFDKGRLRKENGAPGPRDWMTGAIYDQERRLVPLSQRRWTDDVSAPVAVDPDVVRAPDDVPTLRGRWRYAGHWTQHFGHFLVEVVTNLHPPREGAEGIIAHRSFRGGSPGRNRAGLGTPDLTPWQAAMLELAGYGELPVRIVRHQPARVEAVDVDARPVLLKASAAPPAVRVWRRMSDAVGARGNDARVFVSRSRFNAADLSGRAVAADPTWDRHLDQAMALAGFTVVHPEELTFPEQVRTVRGARVLAGCSGSALHLSALAEPGTRVLEIGDPRTRHQASLTQRMIDAACGHLSAFVPYADRAGLEHTLTELASD